MIQSGIKYFLIIVLCAMQAQVCAQVTFGMMRDSIERRLADGEIISACHKIIEMRDSALAAKNLDALMSAGSYLFGEFQSLTQEERLAIRKAAMYVGRNISKLHSRFDASLPYYLLAHQYAENKERLDESAWYIEQAIYGIYIRLGEFQKAELYGTMVEKSLNHYNNTDSGSEKPYLEKLCRFYTTQGIHFKSRRLFNKSYDAFYKGFHIAESFNFTAALFSNAMGLADLFLEDRKIEEAEKFISIGRGKLSFLEGTPRYYERKAQLETLSALVLYNKQHFDSSIAIFNAAIISLKEEFGNHRRREFSKCYSWLASAYYNVDSLEKAEDIIFKGLTSLIGDYYSKDSFPAAYQLYHENTFIDLFALWNRINQKKFKTTEDIEYLKKALNCIDLALTANDMIRDNTVADPSRLISIADNKELIHEAISINYFLFITTNDLLYFRNARNLFSQSKSVLLNDKSRKMSMRSIMRAADVDSLSSWNNQLWDLHNEKLKENSDQLALTKNILSIQESMKTLYELYQNVYLQTDSVKNYIEYAMHKNEIFALSSIDGQDAFVQLGCRDSLLPLINRMNNHILLKSMSEDQTILEDLYLFLIKPITQFLSKSIVIIPDGEINFVPFEILKNEIGDYLIEDVTISYAYGFESYYSTGPITESPYEIVCLAPTYGEKFQKDPDSTRGKLCSLPFAKNERDSIEQLYGPGFKSRQNIAKHDFIEEYEEGTIFHFAGHAIVSNDNAFLALDSSADVQRQITLNDIASISHQTQLVVLSACETGLGKVESGEGIRSLGKSFMEAGANSTVISLWNVNDQSTAKIMASFHRNIKSGQRKDEALRNAKLFFIWSANTTLKQPYYWSAFIPTGNMEPIFFKRTP